MVENLGFFSLRKKSEIKFILKEDSKDIGLLHMQWWQYSDFSKANNHVLHETNYLIKLILSLYHVRKLA